MTASADRTLVRISSSIPSRAGDSNVGVFFPRHSGDPTSDTPVALYRFILGASSSFPDVACFFVLAPRPRFYGLERIGGCGGTPSPSSRRLREEPAPVSNWDAFYRQGPFVGSSGHYSPGPATRSPLLAMVEPLSGTLAPPWIFVRSSPMIHWGLRPENPDVPFTRRTRRWFHPPPFTSS